jgi:branched-chain amino acid transport system permease protein
MLARSKLLLLGGLLAALLVSLNSSRIDEFYLRIAMLAGINIILAVSLNLVNGYTGQFSLGHAGFMSVGAYTSAAITLHLGPGRAGAGGLAGEALYLCALIGGGLLAALAGFIVGSPSLRLKGDYLAIVTLGFGEIIRVIFTNVKSLGGGLGLNGIPPYTNFFWTYGFAVLTVYAVTSMVHSTYGRGFLAVHDDEVAAEAMGINTTQYKITAFVAGAFFAGIAGGIYAHLNHSIYPAGFDFVKSIEIVVMVILGGMGNTPGVILAAILLTVLPEFLRSIADYRMVIYSLLLVVLMLTRPQGLFSFRKGVKVGGG